MGLLFRAILLCTVTLLAGCKPDYSPNSYSSSAVQQANKVDQGVVIGRRLVGVTPTGTTGAVAGAAAGGIAGSQVGTGVTQAFGALGGGLVGGVVGTAVERTTGQTQAYEYVVRKPNGDLLSVTQQDADPLQVGQKVLVIAGSQARIVADYTVTIDPAPPAAHTDTTAPPPAPVVAAPLAPSAGPNPEAAAAAQAATPITTPAQAATAAAAAITGTAPAAPAVVP
jgi:outer membrane lipoprotein SlyB